MLVLEKLRRSWKAEIILTVAAIVAEADCAFRIIQDERRLAA